MPRSAAFTLSASLVLALGCAKPNTRVELANGDRQPPTIPAAATPSHPGDDGRRPHIERMRLEASVSGLGDMLDAVELVYAQWVPPEPGAPPLDFQTFIDVALVQWGFGPAWFSSVDLDGLHTLDLALPHDDQVGVTDADLQVAASIAARNPSALVEGFPPDMRPEPMQPNMWQVLDDDGARLLFRAGTNVLEAATSLELLDSLAASRQALGSGPRVRARLSNFEDDFNEALRPTLDAQQFDRAKQQEILDALELELDGDFGRDRDLVVRTRVIAPFGQAFAGGARSRDPSALAKLLPTGAWFVMVQAWGPSNSAKLVTPSVERLDLPPNLESVAKELIAGGQALAVQFGAEGALASYVDRKGRMTMVFVTDVADETAAHAALLGLFTSLESQSPKLGAGVRAKLDRGAYRSGKATTDVLSVELPDGTGDGLDGMPWLLGTAKPTLEIAGTVAAGKLVLALGPGHRELLATLARRLAGSSDAGLERGGGLATARELSDGCQACIAIDPVATADGLLAILAANPDSDRSFRKLIDSTRKRLLGLKLGGELSFAASFDAQRWEFAAAVPKSLLFLDAATAKQILESFTAVADDYDRLGTATHEEVCRHVMKVMEGEMRGTATAPSQAQEQEFLQKCVVDLAKEREKIGDKEYRRQVKCVMKTHTLDEMMKCEPP